MVLRRAPDGALVVGFTGRWQLSEHLPSTEALERELQTEPGPPRLTYETDELQSWDTTFLTLLSKIGANCERIGVPTDRSGLPAGVRRLLDLAEAVPEKKGARKEELERPFLARLGDRTLGVTAATTDALGFLGESAIALGRFLTGRASYRRSDFVLVIQQSGAEALPIVTLVSFLVGLILAFVGAVQLEKFGAAIYVADLVAIGMVRDMGAMMTAIVMAGRTGAAFAAELGTMKVTQEIDALTTMGISPMEFLVLPRMVALFLMMPLLCLYSDLVSILGGAVVGTGMLGLSAMTYYHQTVAAVSVGDLVGGVFKASVYGALIALSGCLRGMQCGSSSSAVGDAATSAVVTSIVLVVSACGMFAVVFFLLGI